MRKPISSRINYIYNNHYKEQNSLKNDKLIIDIVDFLQLAAKEESNLRYSLALPSIVAMNKSYFLDVIRFKEYHMSPDSLFERLGTLLFSPKTQWSWLSSLHNDITGKKISNSKVATLTAKWFLKCLPISISPKSFSDDLSEEDRHIAIYCNESFLLFHICDLLKINFADLDDSERYDLIYSFKYRTFDEASYYMIFANLEKKHRQED